MNRTRITLAALFALCLAFLTAAPAEANHVYVSNSVSSVWSIVTSTDCSNSTLSGNRRTLAAGQISYAYGHGFYVPSGHKASLRRNGVDWGTVTGPYTRCTGGYNWRVTVTT